MKSHGELRNINFRRSVLTSIAGRFSGVALQVISLPIAAKSLGNEGFALYSTMVAVLSWLSLSNLSVGPALSVRLSSAVAKNDFTSANFLFSAAWQVTLYISGFLTLFAASVAIFTDLPKAVLPEYGGEFSSVTASLLLVFLFFFLFSNLLIVEAAQVAMQQTYRFNIFSGIGVLFAAVAVYLVSLFNSSVIAVLVAVNAPTTLMRLFNALSFLRRSRFFSIRLSGFDKKIAYSLMKEGALFSMSGTLNNFLCLFFPIILIAKICSPSYSASFSALINSIIILSAFFAITLIPLRGALPEAKARSDSRWIRMAYVKVMAMNLAYSVSVAIIFSTLGEEIFKFWYQESIKTNRAILSAVGVYFVLHAIEYTNYSFLSALGYVKNSSFFIVIKAVVFSIFFFVMANEEMVLLPFAILISTSLLLSALPLFGMCYFAVKK